MNKPVTLSAALAALAIVMTTAGSFAEMDVKPTAVENPRRSFSEAPGDVLDDEERWRFACWDCASCSDCNERHVTCDVPRPACQASFVREVVEGCWGDCVPANQCYPVLCKGTEQCPPQMTCRFGHGIPTRRFGVCVWTSHTCETHDDICGGGIGGLGGGVTCNDPLVPSTDPDTCFTTCVYEWQCGRVPKCQLFRTRLY